MTESPKPSNVYFGPFAGANIPYDGDREWLMLTRYNTEDDAELAIYHWDDGRAAWFYQVEQSREGARGYEAAGERA